ncbi:uncharacterized protein LOC106163726 [Lingula anatina]|uniref:Uncharacterized protein LOC106163726 n=1 Tax=Lingula anatina TaxID=7574 RepID=A0A1S3IH85_LINAN|nr:uncharacterized protein LOC106163726 [Lingula anatina]|eukprot:XP_013396849.1 uncharacterized protein LOC106163726 [Lingula anatina]
MKIRLPSFTLKGIFVTIILLLAVSFMAKRSNTQVDRKETSAPRVSNRKNPENSVLQTRTNTADDVADDTKSTPPCGQICDYSIRKKSGDHILRKDFNCRDIFFRLKHPSGQTFKPPLKNPPPEMLQDFTQNGTLKLHIRYLDDSKKRNKTTFTSEDIKKLLKLDNDQIKMGSYGEDSDRFKKILYRYRDELKDKTGIVIGSQSPWLEVMLLNLGVKHVTTVDYNPVFFDHPQLSFKLMSDTADEITNDPSRRMDFAVSFSSLEHSGLGRYGDPINPYGDLEAAAQVWCMLKPGALFLLAVPGRLGSWEGTLYFNMHRDYGGARLEQIAANFEELERGKTKKHIALVLRKPV